MSYTLIKSTNSQAVLLNVILDNPMARQLGIENHVCEVQLVPSAFACMQVITTALFCEGTVLSKPHGGRVCSFAFLRLC